MSQVAGNQILNFYRRHPTLFLKDVQRSYPLTEDQIDRYADKWNWSLLSHNPNIEWTQSLVQCFHDEWDWSALSGNVGLPWSPDFIAEFAEQWNWPTLSCNEALPWSIDLIDQYAAVLDWGYLVTNTKLPWSIDFIRCHSDRWDWSSLSMRKTPPWSVRLIDEFAERWDWRNLSSNHTLPWSVELIERYKDHLAWDLLDFYLPQDLWELYADRCPGKRINPPWNVQKMTRLEGRDHAWHRIVVPGLSLDLILQNQERWDWLVVSHDYGSEANAWPPRLIEEMQAKWDWSALSANENLNWSADLLKKFEEKWDWISISRNPAILWSMELLLTYESRLNIDLLAHHLGITHRYLKASDVTKILDEALNFATPPKLDEPSDVSLKDFPQTITIKKQPFALKAVRPYQRKDGSPSKILVWESSCDVCGQPYEYTSPVVTDRGKFPLTCPAHRGGKRT